MQYLRENLQQKDIKKNSKFLNIDLKTAKKSYHSNPTPIPPPPKKIILLRTVINKKNSEIPFERKC